MMLIFTLLACGFLQQSTHALFDNDSNGVVENFLAHLDELGYDSDEGSVRLIKPEDWSDVSRDSNKTRNFGSAGSFKYLLYDIPQKEGYIDDIPLIHEAATNKTTLSGSKLREDEAIIVLGKTPPEIPYYGFTSYLGTRVYEENGNRTQVNAALCDTLNIANMNVEHRMSLHDGFDKYFVIVYAADYGIYDAIKTAMEASGIPLSILNLQVLWTGLLRMGIDKDSDVIHLIARFMGNEDSAEVASYLERLPLQVFRVTPTDGNKDIAPLPKPIVADRSLSDDESYLSASFDSLDASVKRNHPGYKHINYETFPQFTATAEQCIQEGSNCDNAHSDASYFTSAIFRQFHQDILFENGEYFVIYGVNNEKAGFARYANLVAYSMLHEGDSHPAIARFDSVVGFPGSASKYIADDPEREKFFAVTVRRTCPPEEEGTCFAVPSEYITPLLFAFRSYLHPEYTFGPDYRNLLVPKVLFVAPRNSDPNYMALRGITS